MSNFSREYKKNITEIEKAISNPDERAIVMDKVNELSFMYMDLIDRITKIDDSRIDALEESQDKVLKILLRLSDTIDLIKSDIYEEEGYDFEVVCPYCNHEFVADIEDELREEIECPECHNKIELDWDDEEEEGGCGGCASKNCSHCVVDFPKVERDEEEHFEDFEDEEYDDDDSDFDDDM